MQHAVKPMLLALLPLINGLIDLSKYITDYLYQQDANSAIRIKGRLIDAQAKIGAAFDILEEVKK